ncbi:MAG: protein-tyrosine phosphatase [Cellvibrionaceae bacterium]
MKLDNTELNRRKMQVATCTVQTNAFIHFTISAILTTNHFFFMSLFHYVFDKLYPLIRFIYEQAQGNRWYDQITDKIWLGGAPTYARDYDFLIANKIGAVVDIRNERSDDLALYKRHDIRHLKLRVPDIHVPSDEVITAGVDYIQEQVEDGRSVYIHCAKGRGRSATLIAGWLMKYQSMTFEEARDFMVSKRKLVKLEPRHGETLKLWHESTNYHK